MTLKEWNARQGTILHRWGRLYRVALTPEAVLPIAVRYANKHAAWRASLAT